MDVVKVQQLIMGYLNDFVIQNRLNLLSNNIKDTYGFELCLGNCKNYFFINYCMHNNERGKHEIIVGFGKRSFIKDTDFNFVSMKPHYRLEDLVEGFCSEVTFNYETDKGIICILAV